MRLVFISTIMIWIKYNPLMTWVLYSLSWTEHVNYVCKKAYKRIGILIRINVPLLMAARELFCQDNNSAYYRLTGRCVGRKSTPPSVP